MLPLAVHNIMLLLPVWIVVKGWTRRHQGQEPQAIDLGCGSRHRRTAWDISHRVAYSDPRFPRFPVRRRIGEQACLRNFPLKLGRHGGHASDE